jgi:hypothetical protein
MKKVFLLFLLMVTTGTFLHSQDVNVTFQVDMRVKITTGYFNPASDVVTCPGDFNNWLNEPPANAEKVMSDADNDSIYTITIAMAPNTVYGYKFNVGLGWDGKDENKGNRSVSIGAADTTLLPCFFNNYIAYTGDTTSVTFNIDMQLPAGSAFDPSTDHVFVAGPFTNWGSGAIEMEDLDNDSIYTVTVDNLISGDLLIYKFIHSASTAASGTWESPEEGDDYFLPDRNRIEGIVDSNNVISRFWNNTDPNVTTGNGNIFFEVDMSVLTELGVFNPDLDSVQLRGSFNGWNASDPPRSLMNQDPADPNHWFLDVPFVNEQLNLLMHYKYFINNPGDPEDYSNTGWEVSLDPSDVGNRDRPVRFEGNPDQEAGLQYFDGIRPDWVIPEGTTVECEFSVDMTYATLADTQGTQPVFNPTTDSVLWIPRLPLYYAAHGLAWPGEYPRLLYLTDPDQNMIYTGTLVLEGPDFNGFLYNYAYTSTSGLIHEEGTQEELRVRFIAQSGPRAFVSPYTMPLDIWSNSPKPEEAGPVVGVTDKGLVALTYKLDQNYPNPFNPSTKISFSIPEQGLVTIKVYNLLGEAVATLLNDQLKSGIYEVDFNASGLSSGIYFYTIKANSYTATRKMILMK